MKVFNFALAMLKADYKKSMFYCFTLMLTTMIMFLFFNLVYNPSFIYAGVSVNQNSQTQMIRPFMYEMTLSSILALVVLMFSCMMVFFVNNYYISRKTKEIAVALVSGASIWKIACYLMIQNGFIMLIGMPIGVLIGYLLNPFINTVIFNYLGMTGPLWSISSEGFVFTFAALFLQAVSVTMVDAGFVYRNEVTDLISGEKRMTIKDKRSIRYPTVVFDLLYIASFGIIIMERSIGASSLFMCVNMVGLIGLFYYRIPKLLKHLQDTRFLNNRQWLILLGNLFYSYKNSKMLITVLIVSVSMLMSYLGVCISSKPDLILVLLAYFVSNVLLAISIGYKIGLEADTRKKMFESMFKMGYLKKDLKHIITKEVFLFFSSLIILLMVGILVTLSQLVIYEGLDMILAVLMVLGFLIPMIVMMFVSRSLYIKTVITKRMEEK